MSVATTRPHSSRNAAATAASTSAAQHLPDRPHFDRPEPRAGDLRRDLDRLVEILAVDDVVAADLLLGLGERTVGGEHLAVAHPHGRRVGGRAAGARRPGARPACPSPRRTRRTRRASPPPRRGRAPRMSTPSAQIISRYRMRAPRRVGYRDDERAPARSTRSAKIFAVSAQCVRRSCSSAASSPGPRRAASRSATASRWAWSTLPPYLNLARTSRCSSGSP